MNAHVHKSTEAGSCSPLPGAGRPWLAVHQAETTLGGKGSEELLSPRQQAALKEGFTGSPGVNHHLQLELPLPPYDLNNCQQKRTVSKRTPPIQKAFWSWMDIETLSPACKALLSLYAK